MKTRGAVLLSQRAPLEIFDMEIPSLAPGQVLVKVAYSGLCHSQLNEIDGVKGPDPYLPHTLGHEGSGTVLEVGSEVTKVSPGDSVVISWMKGKGREIGKTSYSYRDKTIQSGAVSTFLSHAVLSENRVIKIPSQMPLKEAALLGCALPTGAGVIRREMNVQKGQSVAIFGVGGVGLSALVAAKAAGAHPLIAIDIHEDKLKKASELGATHTFRADAPFLEAILDLTSGQGVDFAVEAAGKRQPMEMAFRAIRPGGLCVLAGNLPKGETISIDPFELIRGKKIAGTWGGKSNIEEDVEHYTQLFLQNSFPLSPLISHVGTLDSINEQFALLRSGQSARILIQCS